MVSILTGTVPCDNLGTTLMHEHVLYGEIPPDQRTASIEFAVKLLSSFNNFGFEFDTPWNDLVYLIRFLCDKGHANRVLTSVDCNWEWKNGKQVFEASEKHPETARRTYGYMITEVVPELLKAGFSAAEVRTFLVENPRRFFADSLRSTLPAHLFDRPPRLNHGSAEILASLQFAMCK